MTDFAVSVADFNFVVVLPEGFSQLWPAVLTIKIIIPFLKLKSGGNSSTGVAPKKFGCSTNA